MSSSGGGIRGSREIVFGQCSQPSISAPVKSGSARSVCVEQIASMPRSAVWMRIASSTAGISSWCETVTAGVGAGSPPPYREGMCRIVRIRAPTS